jgi:hypothetical protein
MKHSSSNAMVSVLLLALSQVDYMVASPIDPQFHGVIITPGTPPSSRVSDILALALSFNT